MKQMIPFIHTIHCLDTLVESGMFDPFGIVYEHVAGYHALFAAQVVLEPYEVVARRKLGWVERDLLDEILDRQGRFIASLHFMDSQSASPDPNLRTVALRYIAYPDTRQVDVILMGKAFAPGLDQARAAALGWYEEINALLSPDYRLVPLCSQTEFVTRSGQQLLEEVSKPEEMAEIRRFEMFLPRPVEKDVRETHYLVYPFAWHRNGMEQVWQVMASLSVPTAVSVLLRPAYLYEAEELHLTRFYEAAKKLTESGRATDRLLGEQALQIYTNYLFSWRQPYLVRVQLAVPRGVPRTLARAAGCAISYSSNTGGGTGFSFPGYEFIVPEEQECETARDNVCMLEMDNWGCDQAAPPYRRFRHLSDVKGVQSVFRLPHVPKAGMPGAAFDISTDASIASSI